jgi:hypothetical protein
VGGGGDTGLGIGSGLTVPLGGTVEFGGEGGAAVDPVVGGSVSSSWEVEEPLFDGSALVDGSTVPEGPDADESPCFDGSSAPAQAVAIEANTQRTKRAGAGAGERNMPPNSARFSLRTQGIDISAC